MQWLVASPGVTGSDYRKLGLALSLTLTLTLTLTHNPINFDRLYSARPVI